MNAAPPSYATAAEARAYVARVLAHPRPSPPRVYVIAPAGSQSSPMWPKIEKVIQAKLRGAEVLDYPKFFPGGDRGLDDRVEQIAARASGAFVVTRRWNDGGTVRYLLGEGARGEADALTARSVPVLVLAPAAVVAWPDVRIHPAASPGAPKWLSVEVDMPAPPPGVLLPTAAASYRAMGITPPGPRPARKPGPPRPGGQIRGKRAARA